MISLRYHIVSIAAVFLALAIGVVLGSTTLSNTLFSGLSHQKQQLTAQLANTRSENDALRAKLAGADQFAAGVAPAAVRGALNQHSVALVTTADANQHDVTAVRDLIRDAGGSVTAQVQLTKAFTDTNQADQLRDVVTRVLPSGARLPDAADPGSLAGGLMGSLLLQGTNEQSQADPSESAAALSALTQGGFVKVTGQPHPAQLALVLTGGAEHGDNSGNAAATIARFAGQLDQAGSGGVLAGRTGSSAGNGPVGVVRADQSLASHLSTVDDVDSPQGQVATVRALAEQATNKAGQYGSGAGAQSELPERTQD